MTPATPPVVTHLPPEPTRAASSAALLAEFRSLRPRACAGPDGNSMAGCTHAFFALCLALLLGRPPLWRRRPLRPARLATARLLSSRSSVGDGDFSVALEQRIKPHWHTYWLNLGDSGQATSLQWTLPAGGQPARSSG